MAALDFIRGFTFRLQQSKHHGFADQETFDSLDTLVSSTGADTIILAFVALQDTPQSEIIHYQGDFIPTVEELTIVIRYIRETLGLSVILKPMVNCKNGVWRAHINFFDVEVPCEPKWSKWFESYMEYMLHFSVVAEKTNCEMLMIGCELVQSERKDKYWRTLVEKVRKIYNGLLTYNTDKYQEGQVAWWDCLDVISSSGYYPQSRWNENLDRIEKVVEQYDKPFFFAECGCMCRVGCEEIPNNWEYQGEFSLQTQANYYKVMFEECSKRPWVGGFGCWDWVSNYQDYPIENSDYSVYKKPSADIIKSFYSK